MLRNLLVLKGKKGQDADASHLSTLLWLAIGAALLGILLFIISKQFRVLG